MAALRKRLQGTWNILRFNRHFYGTAIVVVILLSLLCFYLTPPWSAYLLAGIILACSVTLISILVSCYIYDLSGLYKLNWIPGPAGDILNIHAGFDETSVLIREKFPGKRLTVLDFHDPGKHTALSLKIARKTSPPYPGTIPVIAAKLPLADQSQHLVCVLFAAHEIRNRAERQLFFRELRRVLHPKGQIVIAEHLRDGANFLAYTIGFTHFYPRSTWLHSFEQAGLRLKTEQSVTPFIRIFILETDDTLS